MPMSTAERMARLVVPWPDSISRLRGWRKCYRAREPKIGPAGQTYSFVLVNTGHF